LPAGQADARGDFVTHVIVLGNEKGGSGKSTAAMHITIALLKAGHRVAAIDLDMRQQSFSRYLENRRAFAESKKSQLAFPVTPKISPSSIDSREEARRAETEHFTSTLQTLADCQFVVIDCPGADTHLSRLAHAHADTIVTPLNDSFVDFDLLARLHPETGELLGPSRCKG